MIETPSVKLHRVITAPVEKVFKAFSNPDAIPAWFPPYGFICKVESFDFKVNGQFKMSFTNFTTGNSHSFGGEFLEIVPNEFLKYSDKFDNPELPGQIITSIWFKTVQCGTDLTVIQENIPAMIPLEMCYLGWQETLDKLKRLVEPNIPD